MDLRGVQLSACSEVAGAADILPVSLAESLSTQRLVSLQRDGASRTVTTRCGH